jgi:NADH-quinone oxidoreductase subunit J
MPQGLIDPVFAACAGVSLLSALMVVTRRNPVYSALWLMQCFLAFAVIFFRLGATFVGAMHILVYTGAILVLFLFVIMLLNLKPEELGLEAGRWQKFLLTGCCVVVAASLSWSGKGQYDWSRTSGDAGPNAMTLDGPKAHPAVLLNDERGEPARGAATDGHALKDGEGKPIRADWGGVRHLGRELFYTHAVPFEILSVLIIVAVLGGVVLAKRKP